ncbi:MAG: AraC family transcriptional regulator [Clostridia bacterium]|nr:AraC family transcriptional regulator [Clostridia bacterium]
MIQNLNKLSFARFGTILNVRGESRGFPAGGDYVTQDRAYTATQVVACRSEGFVYLDYLEGMTLLAVEGTDGAVICFYLDKPVCLKAGVRFAVVPFQWECSVRICYHEAQPPVPESHFLPADDFRISYRLRLRNIYTMFYQEKEKGFLFKGEKHDVLELTYVDKGQLHSVVGGVDYLLHQGDMMVYGVNQWHMQYADTDCATSFITITFDMEGDDLSALTDRVFTMSPQDVDILKTITYEQERNDEYSGDMILYQLGRLLIQVLRSQNGTVDSRLRIPAALNAENDIINRALRYVAEHVREKLSVGIVARGIGVSPSHLTALFHKSMNIAPGEYIRRTKLEESKQLIREGRLNFSQISEALSYSTVHHFSRQFKEKFGITPSEYAKAIK